MWWASAATGRAAAVPPPLNGPRVRGLGCRSPRSAAGCCRTATSLALQVLAPAGGSRRLPPPPWPCSSAAAAGLGAAGAGLAATSRAARKTTDGNVITAELAEQIKEALEAFRKEEEILERYLRTALEPWPSDYLEMQPLLEGSAHAVTRDPVGALNQLVGAGALREVSFARRQLGGQWLSAASCDVQGAGFVVGMGFAGDDEGADQLAAQQALSRLVLPEDYVAEISRCAAAVTDHKHHSGAKQPALYAAEALDALRSYLKHARVAAFCPCGKAWMAAISAQAFDTLVTASSADWRQEVATALAAEIFISRLRWAIRVPLKDPHNPREWARTWDQRAPDGKPWGGFARHAPGETVEVARLGGSGEGEDVLEQLLGTAEEQQRRRGAMHEAKNERLSRPKRGSEAGGAGESRGGSRRGFAVTPPAKDPRRPELVGRLPVEQLREELGRMLGEAQVLAVSGGTGSGKSTQVPQFLVDDWRAQGEGERPPRVIVTQPRRLAAISVAERVAWERKEPVGRSVGYSVQGDSTRPRSSSSSGTIEFVTVGTLLRRAIDDPLLLCCDTVVVDEVHERDMLTDFLLILLREVVDQRADLRILLMSATLDVAKLSSYFRSCPRLQVPPGPLHPVEEQHLEDPFFEEFSQTPTLLQMEAEDRSKQSTAPQLKWCGAHAGADLRASTLEIMEATVRKLLPDLLGGQGSSPAAVLCFLPGWSEIRHLRRRLQDCPEAVNMWILPLHSTLPKEEQRKVFEEAPKQKVKVILSTNIAESSVTVNDVRVVVDSGLQRELSYDAARRMSCLDTIWVSQSSAVQRKGRAGRVKAGRLLRLYSRDHLEALPKSSVPEMQRCDLAQTCLQAVALGRDPHRFLAEAPDPPPVRAIEAAMAELVALDAVEAVEPPRLLPVGEVLARLPLEPTLGRSAMLGAMLGLPKLTASLLAVSGGSTPFIMQGRREDVLAKQREFCGWSDAIASTRALLEWEDLARTQGEAAASQWARSNMLSQSQLSTACRVKTQILRDLRRVGLLSENARSHMDGGGADGGVEAVLESRSEIYALMDVEEEAKEEQDEEEEEETPRTSDGALDAQTEPLLAAILCSAYPTNLAAKRPQSFRTRSLRNALVAPSSVNAALRDGNGSNGGKESKPEKISWWLFGEMQKSGKNPYMHGVTRLEPWQVALFGGLKVRQLSTEAPVLELDGWITVRGLDDSTGRVLQSLRQELRDALGWQALAALRSSSAASAQARHSQRLISVAADIIRGNLPSEADLESLASEQPRLGKKEGAGGAAGAGPEPPRAPAPTALEVAEEQQREEEDRPSQRRARRKGQRNEEEESQEKRSESGDGGGSPTDGFTSENLWARKMDELKALLRERGLRVGGRKAELVERLLNAQDASK